MGVSGRSLWFLLFVVFANHLALQGTFVASQLEGEKEAGSVSFEAKEVTSWNFHEADYPCNPAVAESSRLPRPTVSQDGINGMELPLSAVRGQERCQQELLQQLWVSLHSCQVVAHDTVPRSFCKQTTKGTTATEDIQWWQGRATQSTALWTGGIFKGRCSPTMGGNYPNQDGVFVTPQGSRASRGACGAHGGEDGRTRSSFSPEASPFGERCSGPRDLGQVGRDREVHVGFDTPTTITHKTVNQLKRAEKAFESTLAQIKELDEKWKIFSESLKTKFSEQGALYKAKRKQLVAKNTETKEKIGLLRQEIQKAAIKPEVEELPVDLLEEPELGEMKIDLTLASDSDEDARSRSRTRKADTRASPLKAAKLEA